MVAPIRPRRALRFAVRLRSLAVALLIVVVYVLVLTRGHVPTHVPLP